MSENNGEPRLLYQLDGVTKSYGTGGTLIHAIDGVDMTIGEGEFVCIVGPSGSGKSTLLQLLGALDRPSAGTLEFEGQDLVRCSDGELADLRLQTLGFIFQQFNLIPTLNARENVEVALAPLQVGSDERRQRATEGLRSVGLEERAGHLPSQLSGGEQQRVAIARALANKPDILLADEPTGNLDTRNGQTILDLLRRLWFETGLTVVLITHDRAIAAQSPRTIVLGDGRIVSDEARMPAAETGGDPEPAR